MAEEDLLFGKNRHFYGGIAPSNMRQFRAKRDNANNRVEITYTLPSETIINGQLVCTVAGAVIRKSRTGYPETEFDGELLADVTASGTVYDTNVDSEATVYYAAFPYSKMGVYNRNKLNRTSVGDFSGGYIFGYDLDMADSDPSTRVSYPEDVDNYGFASAKTNLTSGSFNYGDWSSEAGAYFMPKPCMLKYNGSVYEYLNPNDYTKNTNGSASKVSDTSFEGNAMMEWPKIYTKRWSENGIYHFRCSDVKIDEDWDCWCNYDVNDNEIDHFYTGIYLGHKPSGAGTTLRSISGKTCSTGETIAGELSNARQNGDDWTINTLADHLLITDLLVMMGKTTDILSAFGMGYSSSSSTKLRAGSMDTKGLFYGTSNASDGVKIFGMENYWGNVLRFAAGMIVTSSGICLKYTRGTKDGSTTTDYNATGSGYITGTYDFTSGISSGSNYMYETLQTDFGRLPYKTGSSSSGSGSSTKYECATVTWGSNRPSGLELGIGGSSGGGPFYMGLNTSVNGSSTHTGASLSCKPSAT